MSPDFAFSKENIDGCLKALGEEYRRLSKGSSPVEIILVGGAAVLMNYEFRLSSHEVDADMMADPCMKEAIHHVGDKLKLPNGWINEDFVKTKSYSPHLRLHSTYYKTFSNVLKVYTIKREYLMAMKLMAFREYRSDLSDIIGILYEEKKLGKPLTMDEINKAVIDFYDGWDGFPKDAKPFIEKVLSDRDLDELHGLQKVEEKKNERTLLEIRKENPDKLNEANLRDVLASLKSKKK